MNDINITLKSLTNLQTKINRNKARFKVICCGRRTGKTTFIVWKAIHVMLESKHVGLWLPDFKFLPSIWKELIRVIPEDAIKSVNKAEHFIELITGGSIKCFSVFNNPDSGRGEKYHLALIDESSLIANLKEIWEATIRPTLVDYEGEAIFTGTPKGKNDFWQLYKLSLTDEEWAHFTASTLQNPHLPSKELAKIKLLPKSNYNKQEYFAEFIDDGGELFGPLTYVTELKPSSVYKIGVDVAKSQDFTVVAIFNEFNQMVRYERWNTQSWQFINEKIGNIVSKYPGADVLIDGSGVGAQTVDYLESMTSVNVKKFVFTESSRMRLLENLAFLIDNDQIEFIEDDLITHEFEAFGRYVKNGKVKLLSSAEHDDIVMACGLAMQIEEFTPVFGNYLASQVN